MVEERAPLVSVEDAITALTLAICAPVSWFFSESGVRKFCRLLARIHIRISGSKAGDLHDQAIMQELGIDAKGLEKEFVATVYEENCLTLREHRRKGWNPAIELNGTEHITQGLEAGRGVVLWIIPSSYAELVVKKALFSAGLPLVNLRSHVHPYSSSRFGRRFLNRIRTSVEDRYLKSTVVLYPHREAAALREMQQWLRKNAVVSIVGIASADNPEEASCLGGVLRLALGAPTLAKLGRAPLLPVHTSLTDNGGYCVTVGAPLGEGTGQRAPAMAKEFAIRTSEEVPRSPTLWRGWFTRSLWRPKP